MNERAVFDAALDIHDPEKRAEFLHQACGGDSAQIENIQGLLKHYEQLGSFLAAPAAATIDQPNTTERPGTVIGAYKLLQQIGEGGMGTVFMAEQTHPVQRKVAVKVIKAGMDSRQVIARFEAERQALAMMDHVNIARVLDAGTTGEPGASASGGTPTHGQTSPACAGGRPYFVMELVHGVPITKYCDDNHLTPRARLELFVPVCQAIQHAHQKGIIHRDIKPSNVMVTLYDGKPVPKVIDFGVAKATEQKLTERTLFTQYGTMVGTLEYMSPEQAEMSALGVDTRSDIYSLGALLYELLTGSTPLTRQRMKEAAYGEILRMIKEDEPPKPSTRLSDSGEALASISANRHTEPAKLTRLVRGELDWIVMRALEKDRNRRYETANDFAMDVQRYLADEPVRACPPSRWYRFNKFARRNKAALGTAALIAGALILGLGISTWQWLRAEHHAKQAEAAATQAQDERDWTFQALEAMTSQVASDWLAGQRELTPAQKQFLQSALVHYRRLAQGVATTQADGARLAAASLRVGKLLDRLGDFTNAEAAYRQSESVRDLLILHDPGNPAHRRDRADTRQRRAFMLRALNQWDQAEDALRRCVMEYEALCAEHPEEVRYRAELAGAHSELGSLLRARGRLADSELAQRESIRLRTRLVAEQPKEANHRRDLSVSQNSLGALLLDLKRSDDAERAFLESLQLKRDLASEFPQQAKYREDLAIGCNNLVAVLKPRGRLKDAEHLLREGLVLHRQLVEEFPSMPQYRHALGWNLNNLGIVLADLEHWQEADEMQQQSVTVLERLSAEYPQGPSYLITLCQSQTTYGNLLRDQGRYQAALTEYSKAIAALEPLFDRDPRNAIVKRSLENAVVGRTGVWERMERFADALKDWDRVLELNQGPARDSWRLARCTTLVRAGEVAQAIAETEPLTASETASASLLYNGAAVHALASVAVKNDPDRQEVHAQRALELLRRAIGAGYTDFGHLTKDPSFQPLRSRLDFQRLLVHEP
jgi:serine/threonine protein kinase